MIITICNQKGGVGKTTTTVNLAHGLALAGYGVLVIDVDGQGNSTKTLTGGGEFHVSAYDLFLHEAPVKDCIVPGVYVDVIPSSDDLSSVPMVLATDSRFDYQLRLKNRLAAIKDEYDFILIDTGPTLDYITVNAMAASDGVIIPLSPGGYELDGTQKLFDTVASVQKNFNPSLSILGVLLTMTDHTNMTKAVEKRVREALGDRVFKNTIPNNVKVKEASAAGGTTLYHYAPEAIGATAYALFSEEVRERVGVT